MFEESLSVTRTLTEIDPTNVQAVRDMCFALGNTGRVLWDGGDLERAAGYWLEAAADAPRYPWSSPRDQEYLAWLAGKLESCADEVAHQHPELGAECRRRQVHSPSSGSAPSTTSNSASDRMNHRGPLHVARQHQRGHDHEESGEHQQPRIAALQGQGPFERLCLHGPDERTDTEH